MGKNIIYNQVEKEYFNKACIWSNTLLFEPEIAIAFINRCKALNINILGIDAFKKINDEIQPSIEHSIAFAYSQNTEMIDVWYYAGKHIKEKSKFGFIFEIVCEAKPKAFSQ